MAAVETFKEKTLFVKAISCSNAGCIIQSHRRSVLVYMPDFFTFTSIQLLYFPDFACSLSLW